MDKINKLELFFKTKKGKIILFVCATIIFFLIVIGRRIDSITNPQFWAEDGVFWYTEAYNTTNPVAPFLIPKQGYFQTISRVGASISMLFDIKHAPLIFNLIAIIIQVLPAIFFISRRFENIIPKFYQRFFIGLVYLVLPGTFETNANLTNAQWHLALLMFLLFIAVSSKNIWWKIFDTVFLALAGLSGPFVFFAFPLALVYTYFTKSLKEKFLPIFILSITFLIQMYSFFFIASNATRSKEELGATLINFFKILAGNVFITGILGLNHYQTFTQLQAWQGGILPIIFGIIGLSLLGYVFWKSKIELRLFLIYAFLIFFAGLASPMVSLVKPQWDIMAQSASAGNRYYFFPILAWIVSLIWLAFYKKNKIYRNIAIILLLVFIFTGVPGDYVFTSYENYHFQKQAHFFEKLTPGKTYTFTINPGWKMTLIKK